MVASIQPPFTFHQMRLLLSKLFFRISPNRPIVLNNCKFNTTIRAHILVYGINIKLDIYTMFEKLEFFVKISMKNRLSVMAKMKSAIDNQLGEKSAK